MSGIDPTLERAIASILAQSVADQVEGNRCR